MSVDTEHLSRNLQSCRDFLRELRRKDDGSSRMAARLRVAEIDAGLAEGRLLQARELK